VRVPELTLDDRQRNPLVGHLDRVSMPQLVGCEPPPDTGLRGEAAKLTAAAVADQPRPRVGQTRTQNSGPIGNLTRCSVQRATCSQPQSSIPTILRFPPLTERTSTDPVLGSRSDSVSASASMIRSPARHGIAISPRVRSVYGLGLTHHEDDLLNGWRIGRKARSLFGGRAPRPMTRRRGR
jgi:hypothetical protein